MNDAPLTIKDAQAALRFCDSYSRMETLIDLGFRMADRDWHVVLGEEWSGCDNIGQYRPMLRKMLPAEGPVPGMMKAPARARGAGFTVAACDCDLPGARAREGGPYGGTLKNRTGDTRHA